MALGAGHYAGPNAIAYVGDCEECSAAVGDPHLVSRLNLPGFCVARVDQ